jgi:IS30 family transposase
MRTFTRVTQEQQYQILILMQVDHQRNEIAKISDVHKSAVSREQRYNPTALFAAAGPKKYIT